VSAPPHASRAAGVRIEGVDLSYGAHRVLKHVDVEVRPGEFFAFLGPSGCGKTTLLRLIAGFNQADSGRVLIGGPDVSALPPWMRDVGMVFQSYALWPHMTVQRNVAFGLEERKLPRREIERRVAAALDLVGLADLAERIDEPLSNLDAKLRLQVRRELRDLQRRLGLTAIFVTHDQEEANAVCDRIAVMNEGVVQQVGTPVELYERPANLFVASFLGTANILQGEIIGSGAERAYCVGKLRLPIPSSASVPSGARMVFRPQDARIGASGPDMAAVSGTVASREFLGATMRYVVRIGEAEVIVDTPFHTGDAMHEIEARVTLGVPVRSVLWLSA